VDEKAYIPLTACQDRGLYRISSRNLSLGVFDARTRGFIGIREKFGERFLFTEYHYDTGEPHGTVYPLQQLEEVPAGVVLSEDLGTKCGLCQRQLYLRAAEGCGPGNYVHEDGTDKCPNAWPVSIPNVALYDYLAAQPALPKWQGQDDDDL